MSPVPFEQFGRYLLLETLGRGGAGRIDLALGRSKDGAARLVALKRLRADADESAELHKMLLREAALAARLVHPNIVTMYGVERSGDEVAMVMEYLEGHSLAELVDDHIADGTRVPVAVAIGIARQALHGLHHAHELADDEGRPLDLVHRDFTPHNVFITRDGVVKVLDFGIAKIAGAVTRTGTGLVKGKLGYMAPEQILGTTTDRRIDVFAAGIVVWEMLAGRRIGRPNSISEVVEAATDPLPPIQSVAPWVDQELAAIVDRAIAIEPAERYPTAAALREAFDDYARSHAAILGTAFEIAGHLETTLGTEMRAREEGVADAYPLAAHCLSTDVFVSLPPPRPESYASVPASGHRAARPAHSLFRYGFAVTATIVAVSLLAVVAR